MRTRLGGLVLVLVIAAGSGCGSSSSPGTPDEGYAQYDPTAQLLRGPWLTPAGPGAVTVSWSTDQPARSLVDYGPAATYGTQAVGTVLQPAPEDSGETPTAGWQHRVTVTGLDPELVYHYRVASLAAPTADATLRAAAAPGRSFNFVIFGDVRTQTAIHQEVVDAIVGEAPEVVLNTGDLSTAGGVEDEWNTFFSIERDLLGSTPYLPVYGNHEDVLGRTLFDTYWPAPPGARSPRTYSTDWGKVHITVLDRYKDDLASVAAWLQADLASPAAQAADLRLVSLHNPLYTFSNHTPDLEARAALWPILTAGGVRLVATGHNHAYERFFVDGIQVVVAGGGGAPLYTTDDHVVAAEASLRRVAASQYHYVSAAASATGYRFEAKPVPAGAALDCFVIDPAQPGVDVGCP
ncbi:MAG TPA: metallophosphoesterase family protein [Polyangia bacterium]